jgi:hypothetical protein
MRVLAGSAAQNNQLLPACGSSGFYLIRKTDAQSGEVARQKAVMFGN